MSFHSVIFFVVIWFVQKNLGAASATMDDRSAVVATLTRFVCGSVSLVSNIYNYLAPFRCTALFIDCRCFFFFAI